MGCDIHIYAEVLRDEKWQKATIKVPDGRNYWSFAILADVRNGFGFAGCDLGDPIPFLGEPRGLPQDTSIKDSDPKDENGEIEFDSPDYVWLGDHSFSWFMLSELMALNLEVKHKKRGFVTKAIYDKFQEDGLPPAEWCGGTTNKDYQKIEWVETLKNSAWLIPNIIEAIKPLGEPEKVRVVFGFDN